jgi:phosphoglycolate phosphatase-like HAD superfamily hydrolase
MNRVDGLIFDLDGTLADTLPLCFVSFRYAFERCTGRTYADADIAAMFGPSEEGIFQRVLGDRWPDGYAAYLEAYANEHPRHAREIAGIPELIDDMRARGSRMAIVTGKGPRSTAISLAALGLAPHFDPIECGSSLGGIKPAAIARILAGWGVPPERVAYIGDQPSDMRDARTAGVIALAAAWATTAERPALEAEGPDAVFARVADLVEWLEVTRRDLEAG